MMLLSLFSLLSPSNARLQWLLSLKANAGTKFLATSIGFSILISSQGDMRWLTSLLLTQPQLQRRFSSVSAFATMLSSYDDDAYNCTRLPLGTWSTGCKKASESWSLGFHDYYKYYATFIFQHDDNAWCALLRGRRRGSCRKASRPLFSS